MDPRAEAHAPPTGVRHLPLPPVRRDHLARLATIPPIAQHARGSVADPVHGACTDDVARLLEVDVLHGRVLGWDEVAGSAWASLAFLGDALDPESGRFRNFRDVEGRWLEPVGSEDAHGRAVLALGRAIDGAPERAFREAAVALFRRSLPGTVGLSALRARSSAVIGTSLAVLAMRGDRPVTAWLGAGARLSGDIAEAFDPVALTPAWPWPEPVVTYESALVPRAMIVAGRLAGDRRLIATGLAVADWLLRSATAADGHLSPVGNLGWWPRGGTRARYDQQPIEAASILLCAETAYEATGDLGYLADAERAYGWFLGANDGGIVVADPASGGCHDGLLPGRPEPQPGGGVDPRLAARRGADPPAPRPVVGALRATADLAVEPRRTARRRRAGRGQLRTSSGPPTRAVATRCPLGVRVRAGGCRPPRARRARGSSSPRGRRRRRRRGRSRCCRWRRCAGCPRTAPRTRR